MLVAHLSASPPQIARVDLVLESEQDLSNVLRIRVTPNHQHTLLATLAISNSEIWILILEREC